ncbi:MAG: imidazole glycerol phosphate synthase subunit HisH [Flavobacteriaceae bacterium]|nr:imidazole glycerol phosphate synthase subunit HisH [Flavobacteriaceae bacterium]
MQIAIIDYGAGNVKSIEFAFRRLGVETTLTHDRSEVQSADKVIFPGVGEASSAMSKLKQTGLDEIIPKLEQPVLGICLGMQLMCAYSEENNTKGLGIFDVDVVRFSEKVKVPQIGWNTIKNLKSRLFKDIKENEYMYLVHSYYVPLSSDTIASSNYELEYATAIKKDNFYGVQFHPEKSSIGGEQLLKNFIEL